MILRYLTGEPEEMAQRARQLLLDVDAGRLEVLLEDVVVAEIVWTLSSFYKKSRAEVAALLEPIVGLPGMLNPNKAAVLDALALSGDLNIDFADALLAAKALAGVDKRVCSFDRDFERIPGVARIEPG